MVVENLDQYLDLGHLALFFGLRVNELVIEQMKAAGFGEARESHGYVIQHLIENERTITQLAERMEVTQQAASKTVAEMVRLGILETASKSGDRRTKLIRLSPRTWEAVSFSREERRKIEKRVVAAIGENSYTKAKQLLARCLRELGALERIESRKVRIPT